MAAKTGMLVRRITSPGIPPVFPTSILSTPQIAEQIGLLLLQITMQQADHMHGLSQIQFRIYAKLK